MAKSPLIRRILSVFVFLAILLAVYIYLSYRRDMRVAHTRVSSGSQVVNTPCGPIEFADVGTGPAILAIHGAGGGFDQSIRLAKDLGPTGYRVVAPSRFGYLRTPMPEDASPAAQADAHACLLDALKLQKAIVIGGSMGAPSAMQFCIRHPNRCSALVLLFPIAFAPRAAGELPPTPSALQLSVMEKALKSDFVFWAASKFARDTIIQSVLATPIADFRNASPQEQERALQILHDILPVSAREKGLLSDSTVATTIPRYDLEHITAPTLVISAEDDLFGTYKGGRYTAEHIPEARFVGYPTGGHLLLGHGNDVKRELAEFLRRQSAVPQN
jgi:2-hydroxy-6-oxonona-2,4-dienedioate hydrolase